MIVKSCYEAAQQQNAEQKNQDKYPDWVPEKSFLANKYAIVPATGFARIDQILQLIPISKNAWWTGVREGRFPPSIKLGHRTTVWKAEEIHQLISDLGAEAE